MAELGKAHRRLEKLAGKWKGSETLFPSAADAEGGSGQSTITTSVELGGHYLLIDYARTEGRTVTLRGHGVCGWDPARDRYVLHWFDSAGHGMGAPALGVWKGDTLTFHGKDPGGRNVRLVCTLAGERPRTIRVEQTLDGVSWTELLEVELR